MNDIRFRATIVAFACAVIPLAAHHSTRAAFDDSKLVTMRGVVTDVQWVNPHAVLFLDVEGEDGQPVRWKIELLSPNGLMREGWRSHDLQIGDRTTVDVWLARNLARDASRVAKMRTITLRDGRVISGASGWDGQLPQPNSVK